MEAFAVAEAAELIRPAPLPRFVMLKGLSDDGDKDKNKLEKATGGKFRASAGDNAFRLLRTGMQIGAFGPPMPVGLPEPAPSELFKGQRSDRAAEPFPYFSPEEIEAPRTTVGGDGAGRTSDR